MPEHSFEDMYNSLRRLHNSANEAILMLQEKNKILYEEIQVRDEKLINAQKSLDITKEIMRNAITEQNRIQVDYGNEIQGLKAEVKKLSKASELIL